MIAKMAERGEFVFTRMAVTGKIQKVYYAMPGILGILDVYV